MSPPFPAARENPQLVVMLRVILFVHVGTALDALVFLDRHTAPDYWVWQDIGGYGVRGVLHLGCAVLLYDAMRAGHRRVLRVALVASIATFASAVGAYTYWAIIRDDVPFVLAVVTASSLLLTVAAWLEPEQRAEGRWTRGA